MQKNKFRKIKIIFYTSVVCIVSVYSFLLLVKNNVSMNNEMFVKLLLSGGNTSILYEYKPISIINNVISYFSGLDVNNPGSFLNNGLMYKNESFHNDDYSNLDYLQEVSFYISNPNEVIIDEPIIYIYNSHQLENYSSNNFNPYNITPNVMMSSYILQEYLNKNGLPTIVEETDLTAVLKEYGYLYYQSYIVSREYMLKAKEEYDSIDYFIDVHRDSVSANVTRLTVDEKSYAKVLFVVGLEHDNYEENLELATRLSNEINKALPGLSRGVYKKEGPGVDGIYNQDVSANVILLETGGVDNTIEEVNNTLEIVASVISDVVREDYDN